MSEQPEVATKIVSMSQAEMQAKIQQLRQREMEISGPELQREQAMIPALADQIAAPARAAKANST